MNDCYFLLLFLDVFFWSNSTRIVWFILCLVHGFDDFVQRFGGNEFVFGFDAC